LYYGLGAGTLLTLFSIFKNFKKFIWLHFCVVYVVIHFAVQIYTQYIGITVGEMRLVLAALPFFLIVAAFAHHWLAEKIKNVWLLVPLWLFAFDMAARAFSEIPWYSAEDREVLIARSGAQWLVQQDNYKAHMRYFAYPT